jgi:hypothetical protein
MPLLVVLYIKKKEPNVVSVTQNCFKKQRISFPFMLAAHSIPRVPYCHPPLRRVLSHHYVMCLMADATKRTACYLVPRHLPASNKPRRNAGNFFVFLQDLTELLSARFLSPAFHFKLPKMGVSAGLDG